LVEDKDLKAKYDDSFAAGIEVHFRKFCRKGEDPSEVQVRINLSSGEELLFDGLRIDRLENVNGCLMVRGASPASLVATVVREEQIIRAEFDRSPPATPPRFGFET
jgi:hypothetical protein